MLEPEPRHLVLRWCDWVDEASTQPGRDVFVHGDLHGHNHGVGPQAAAPRARHDFETSGAAEAEYDFRYLPASGPGVELLVATGVALPKLGPRAGRRSRDGVARPHRGSVKRYARSEAALPLLLARPGGGSPVDYVHELRDRFAALGVQPG